MSSTQQHEYLDPEIVYNQCPSEAEFVSPTLSSTVTRQSTWRAHQHDGQAHLALQGTAVVVDHPGADAAARP
jgi:hypothetical protein